ncbi:ABC transporter permease [Eggerthellaceae bacterium zg-1084]|uniref:ABC transporter permease n=1 Tax=Berryella wangjianweii TaxID=2734634 RepID=UPI00155220AD|nr:ABC transporter permease [Berryella wangjianweii]NPD30469.1 ABC transporter permease [Berryella wangjianweii]
MSAVSAAGAEIRGEGALRRAAVALVRCRARNVLLLLIMTSVFVTLVVQACLVTTLSDVESAISRQAGAGFTASSDGAPFDRQKAEPLARLESVKSHAFETRTVAVPQNAQVLPGGSTVNAQGAVGTQAALIGTTNPALHPHFGTHLLTLAEGSMPTGADERFAMVHETFARSNGLSVGDRLTLANEGRSVTLRIAGIFEGTVQARGPLPSDQVENLVFCDLESAGQLSGSQRIETARFAVDTAEHLDDAVKAAQAAETGLDIASNARELASVLDTVAGVSVIMRALLAGITVAGIAILSLVLVFWVRGRLRHIGILLSLGTDKASIAAQLIAEALTLAVLAALVGLAVGQLAGGTLAQAVFDRITDGALEGTAVASSDPRAIGLALALGVSMTLAALVAALAPVLRRSARSILSSID